MITRRSLFGLCLAPVAPGLPESIYIERSKYGVHILANSFGPTVSYSVRPGEAAVLTAKWMADTELPGAVVEHFGRPK